MRTRSRDQNDGKAPVAAVMRISTATAKVFDRLGRQRRDLFRDLLERSVLGIRQLRLANHLLNNGSDWT